MQRRLSIPRARRLQESLVHRIGIKDNLLLPPKTVCGLDVSYTKKTAIGTAVVLEFPSLNLIDQAVVFCKSIVPYIPTFLSFREYPPLSLAYSSLRIKPDLCFVDAHGRSHPRKLGAASHFGILRNIPTIGVAKRLLVGERKTSKNSWIPIVYGDEIVGAEISTKTNAKPIYVSVGHRISLETAIKLTKQCVTKYRLPEPIRRADQLAKDNRRKLIS